MNMLKNLINGHLLREDYTCYNCWTVEKTMTSLFTCLSKSKSTDGLVNFEVYASLFCVLSTTTCVRPSLYPMYLTDAVLFLFRDLNNPGYSNAFC